MSERKYTDQHEWLEADGELITVGITDFAQSELGDIVFVELPEEGAALKAGDEVIVIESVKAAGEVGSPLNGVVEAVNELLADAPETINEDPTGAGWLIKVRTDEAPDLSGFMDEASYKAFTEDC
ncbi:Glycine cleavage system H protein [gamma proteobacterium IMCC2047]|nr:Glycine cleavage system H protein [gamma proteobacterium IMCC2047]